MAQPVNIPVEKNVPVNVPVSSSASKTVPKKGVTVVSGDIQPPTFDNLYVSFRGYGPTKIASVSVLCGDDPPTVTGGYANWTTVARPLQTGVTTFQGYDPVTMAVTLRFGQWIPNGGRAWDVSAAGGRQTEADITTLEWMAGAHQQAGASPFVYVNTYGAAGGTTNLVPSDYQLQAGTGYVKDTSTWPWVINSGIQWGKSLRNSNGDRVYQEASLSLMNYQSFSPPSSSTRSGGYFTVKPGRNNALLIAGAPSGGTMNVEALARAILAAPQNNPISNSRITLATKSLRYKIPNGRQVWVPAHAV